MVVTVIIEDKYCGTDVEVFSDEKAAVDFAKSIVKQYSRSPEDVHEQQLSDWIYYCFYGESCSVRVQRKFLDSQVV